MGPGNSSPEDRAAGQTVRRHTQDSRWRVIQLWFHIRKHFHGSRIWNLLQQCMQVIALRTLKRFWAIHDQAEIPLRTWYSYAARAVWNTPQDIKATPKDKRIAPPSSPRHGSA